MNNLNNFLDTYIKAIKDVYTSDDDLIELINNIPCCELNWDDVVKDYILYDGNDLFSLAEHLLEQSIDYYFEGCYRVIVNINKSLENDELCIYITVCDNDDLEHVSKLLDDPKFKFLITNPKYNINFDVD